MSSRSKNVQSYPKRSGWISKYENNQRKRAHKHQFKKELKRIALGEFDEEARLDAAEYDEEVFVRELADKEGWYEVEIEEEGKQDLDYPFEAPEDFRSLIVKPEDIEFFAYQTPEFCETSWFWTFFTDDDKAAVLALRKIYEALGEK